MKKLPFVFLILMQALLWMNLSAQQVAPSNSAKFDPKKLTFGGDIGFGISNNIWTAGISPQVGYRLTDKFHFGAGLGYRFAKGKETYYMHYPAEGDPSQWDNRAKFRYTENTASFNLFANYYPWRMLIFSVKPEIMHTWYQGKLGSEKYSENKFVPAFTVGGGIYMKPLILQINYELVQDDYSPYSDNVFFSVGMMF